MILCWIGIRLIELGCVLLYSFTSTSIPTSNFIVLFPILPRSSAFRPLLEGAVCRFSISLNRKRGGPISWQSGSQLSLALSLAAHGIGKGASCLLFALGEVGEKQRNWKGTLLDGEGEEKKRSSVACRSVSRQKGREGDPSKVCLRPPSFPCSLAAS